MRKDIFQTMLYTLRIVTVQKACKIWHKVSVIRQIKHASTATCTLPILYGLSRGNRTLAAQESVSQTCQHLA